MGNSNKQEGIQTDVVEKNSGNKPLMILAGIVLFISILANGLFIYLIVSADDTNGSPGLGSQSATDCKECEVCEQCTECPQDSECGEQIKAFEEQKYWKDSSDTIFRYPSNWELEESYGADGGAISVSSIIPFGEDRKPASLSIRYGLGMGIDPTENFDCSKGEIISSEVNDLKYRKVDNGSSTNGKEYIICVSEDDGATFKINYANAVVIAMEDNADGFYSDELDTILK